MTLSSMMNYFNSHIMIDFSIHVNMKQVHKQYCTNMNYNFPLFILFNCFLMVGISLYIQFFSFNKACPGKFPYTDLNLVVHKWKHK